MFDLIDYALDHYTDFIKFEQIANEVLMLHGFENLIPVGGIHDDGVDAKMENFFTDADEPDTLIFQYTLQKNIQSKVNDTYTKLISHGFKFSKLYIVTLVSITNKAEIEKKFRLKHGKTISLHFFDRELFRSTLSSNPEMRSRYFPDLKQQIQNLIQPSKTSDTPNKDYEQNLYKVSLLFAQDKDLFTKSEKNIFDEIILLTIFTLGSCNLNQICDETAKLLNVEKIDAGRAQASLQRLEKHSKIIQNQKDIYSLSPENFATIEMSKSRIEEFKKEFFENVIDRIEEIISQKLELGIKTRIKQKCEESLTDYFKFFALEKNIYYKDYVPSNYAFALEKLQVGLQKEYSEAAIVALGEILEKPTINQYNTLLYWRNSYLAAQILKLDPKQNSIEIKQFQGLSIILDTDFVLNLIVKELNENQLYVEIIHKLLTFGSNIIIPYQVLEEVRKHAEYAHRSYTFFNAKADQLDDEQIIIQVKNLFTKGYFQGKFDQKNAGNFNDYLKNYFYKNEISFLKTYIENEISDKIQYLDLTSIDLNEQQFSNLENMIQIVLDYTKETHKAIYRDEDENREIAETDSRLFLDICQLNTVSTKKSNTYFSQQYYITTSSTRALRAAKELGIYQNIYFSPLHLISLIEKIEPFKTHYDEIQNIFRNPYLTYAMAENSEIINKMLELGVNLKGKNLTFLKYDLGDTYEKILQGNYIHNDESTKDLQQHEMEIDNIYKELEERHFKFINPLKKLIDKLDSRKKEVEEGTKQIARSRHRRIDKITQLQIKAKKAK